MVIKQVMLPKKKIKATDGKDDWEVIEKRETKFIQRPLDSDDEEDEDTD